MYTIYDVLYIIYVYKLKAFSTIWLSLLNRKIEQIDPMEAF